MSMIITEASSKAKHDLCPLLKPINNITLIFAIFKIKLLQQLLDNSLMHKHGKKTHYTEYVPLKQMYSFLQTMGEMTIMYSCYFTKKTWYKYKSRLPLQKDDWPKGSKCLSIAAIDDNVNLKPT